MEKFFYRVGKGDSVMSLAARFNLPQTVIIRDNNLSRDISEGDVLCIAKTAGEIYFVQPFDTLNSVAEKFNVSTKTLAFINGVDYVFYGLNLIIPPRGS